MKHKRRDFIVLIHQFSQCNDDPRTRTSTYHRCVVWADTPVRLLCCAGALPKRAMVCLVVQAVQTRRAKMSLAQRSRTNSNKNTHQYR